MVDFRRLSKMASQASGQSSGETTASHWQLVFPCQAYEGKTHFVPYIIAGAVHHHSRMGSDVSLRSSNICWIDYAGKVGHTLNTHYLLQHHNPDQQNDPISMELIRRLHPEHTPPAVLELIKMDGSCAERTEAWEHALNAYLEHIHNITSDIAYELRASPFCR